MNCLACKSGDTSLIEHFKTDLFFEHLSYERNISEAELEPLKPQFPRQYDIYRCNACHLEFPSPIQGGNSMFYDVIYKHMPNTGTRWEFTEFLKDFSPPHCLLDIGCGDGSFVAFSKKNGFKAKGLDFNPTRVDMGKDKGGDVDVADISNLASFSGYLKSHKDFSAYSLWHVLEHLEEPLKSLQAIHDNSADGAQLVIGVPSDRFYLSHRSSKVILNYPPHHLTKWNATSLEAVGKGSGWRLDRIAYEPVEGTLRSIAIRLAKSLVLNMNMGEELRTLKATGHFTDKATSPRLDAQMNSLFIKIAGRIVFYFLRFKEAGKPLSGMGMYAKYTKVK